MWHLLTSLCGAIALGSAVMALVQLRRAALRLPRLSCGRCGYDISATTGGCPECGVTGRRRSARQVRLKHGGYAAAMLLVSLMFAHLGAVLYTRPLSVLPDRVLLWLLVQNRKDAVESLRIGMEFSGRPQTLASYRRFVQYADKLVLPDSQPWIRNWTFRRLALCTVNGTTVIKAETRFNAGKNAVRHALSECHASSSLLDALLAIADDPADLLNAYAIELLGLLRPVSDRAVHFCVDLIERDHPDGFAAIIALAKMGAEGVAAIESLLQSDHANVRYAGISALHLIPTPSEAAVIRVVFLAGTDSPETRSSARRLLRELPADFGVVARGIVLLRDAPPEQEIFDQELAGVLLKHCRDDVAGAMRVLEHGCSRERGLAAWALAVTAGRGTDLGPWQAMLDRLRQQEQDEHVLAQLRRLE